MRSERPKTGRVISALPLDTKTWHQFLAKRCSAAQHTGTVAYGALLPSSPCLKVQFCHYPSARVLCIFFDQLTTGDDGGEADHFRPGSAKVAFPHLLSQRLAMGVGDGPMVVEVTAGQPSGIPLCSAAGSRQASDGGARGSSLLGEIRVSSRATFTAIVF